MNKTLLGIGKALCYFLVFFISQSVATTVAVFFFFIFKLPSLDSASSNTADLINEILAEVSAHTTLILLISGLLTLAVYVIFFAVRKKNFFAKCGYNKINVLSLIPVAVAGVAFNFFVSGLISLIPENSPLMSEYVTSSAPLLSGNPILSFFVIALLTPVVEETVFRGLIYTRLAHGMPTALALILQGLLFGIMHGTLLWAAYGFVLGIVLGLLLLHFRTLLAPIVFHIFFNAVNFLPINIEDPTAKTSLIIIAVSAAVIVLLIPLTLKFCKRSPVQELVPDDPAL